QNETLAETKTDAELAAEAFDELAAALDKVFGSASDLQAAQDQVSENTAALTKSLEDNGKTLDQNTEAGRANRQQIRDSVKGVEEYITSLAKSGATADDVKGQYDFLRQGLVQQLTQFGLTEEQAQNYIDTLGLTPDNVTTAIELQNQQQAKAQVEDYL